MRSPRFQVQLCVLWLLLGLCAGMDQPTFAQMKKMRKLLPVLAKPGRYLDWDFPVPRPLAGIPMANGKLGILVWGQDSTLQLSVARSGFWDRRWSPEPDSLPTYNAIKNQLLSGKSFSWSVYSGGKSKLLRPRQLPGGLITLPLPDGWILNKGSLHLETGNCRLEIRKKGHPAQFIEIEVFQGTELARITFPPLVRKPAIPGMSPSGFFLKTDFAALSIPEPKIWSKKSSRFDVLGFVQALPQDPPLGIACAWKDRGLWISTGLGADAQEGHQLGTIETASLQFLRAQSLKIWTDFWKSAPRMEIPDQAMQEMYDFGLYKMAICSDSSAPAISLQGPLMEHDRLPPWSNDYHFNVNLQMVYQAFLSTGQYKRLKPLWAMIQSWLPAMTKNGNQFFGEPKSMHLPHACTDAGKPIGGFWTGDVDQASLAWLADLSFQYANQTRDTTFLNQLTKPMLWGAFLGYKKMMEHEPNDTSLLCFPISVSPEFKGARADAWGKNASFQLAACHRTMLNLLQTIPESNQKARKEILTIQSKLPQFTTVVAPLSQEYPEQQVVRIALWENQDLPESHRHHSHLAGVYPFRTVSTSDFKMASIWTQTFRHWSRMGTGGWAGWSVPWASILLSRINQPDAALAMLTWGKANFTNEGRANLHDIRYPFASGYGRHPWNTSSVQTSVPQNEIMQLEAGFGYLDAIHHLLVREDPDGLQVLTQWPGTWKNLSFDGIHTQQGLIIGGTVKEGKVTEIRIRSPFPTKIRLQHGIEKWMANGKIRKGRWVEEQLFPNELLVLQSLD